MTRKRQDLHQKRIECLLRCPYFYKCKSREGKKCKHMGGSLIPVFRVCAYEAK